MSRERESRESETWESRNLFPDNAERRRDRLKRLVTRIQTNPGLATDALVKLLVAWFGLSGKTARGYIDELARYEFIRQERLGGWRPDGKGGRVEDANADLGMGWFANDSCREFFK